MFSRFFPTVDITPIKWRFFYSVLLLAFVVRLGVAFYSASLIHPDETFQYYEQAHRLIYGYGLIPWEYTYGIRSWAIALFVAGILGTGQGLGLDHPSTYIPLVETVFCLISLVLPVAMYRFAQALLNERQAILIFVLGCFWHTLVYLAHKPMPGILASYSLMWMFVLFCRAPNPRRLIILGMLSGLTLVLRYQLLPVLGFANLLALVLLGRSYVYVLIGNLVLLLFAGWLDYMFWGAFMSSYIDNFILNFTSDIASVFGTDGPMFYVRRFISATWGLIVPAVIGLVLAPRHMWPVLAMITVGLLAFLIPAHKEFRFVIWAYPFFLMGLVIFTTRFVPVLRLPARLGSWAVVGMLIAAGAVSGEHIARQVGVKDITSVQRHEDSAAVYSALAADPNVTGIEFRTPSLPWSRTRGYYALHQPVPVYYERWHLNRASPDTAPVTIYISHVVTEVAEGPIDFELVERYGRFYLWRSVIPTPSGGWESYDFNTPLPAPDILNEITPRGAARP